jgi:hypothetical protein
MKRKGSRNRIDSNRDIRRLKAQRAEERLDELIPDDDEDSNDRSTRP